MDSRTAAEAGAAPVFAAGDYRAIREYENGIEEWTPFVEQAYLNLCAAFALGQEQPAGMAAGWWQAKRLEWEYPLETGIGLHPGKILVE